MTEPVKPSGAAGTAAMATLGVGFCSTALMLAWPNNNTNEGDPEAAETADLSASVERSEDQKQQQEEVVVTSLVEVPDTGVAYYHPDHGTTFIIQNEAAAQ